MPRVACGTRGIAASAAAQSARSTGAAGEEADEAGSRVCVGGRAAAYHSMDARARRTSGRTHAKAVPCDPSSISCCRNSATAGGCRNYCDRECQGHIGTRRTSVPVRDTNVAANGTWTPSGGERLSSSAQGCSPRRRVRSLLGTIVEAYFMGFTLLGGTPHMCRI